MTKTKLPQTGMSKGYSDQVENIKSAMFLFVVQFRAGELYNALRQLDKVEKSTKLLRRWVDAKIDANL